MPTTRLRIVKPIETRLDLLRAGRLSPDAISDLISDIRCHDSARAREAIRPLLFHSDEIVRYNALSILGNEWADMASAPKICEMLLHDSSRDCRRLAAAVLGALFEGTGKAEVVNLLRGVLDSAEPIASVRAWAYVALLEILGVPKEERPNPFGLVVRAEQLQALSRYLP